MNQSELILYSFIGVLLLAGLMVLGHYIQVNFGNPTGKGADKRTAAALNRWGAIRGCRVLSGLTLAAGDKTATVENMLIGPFGILLVHTCGARGDYNGTLQSESWSVSLADRKTAFPNPVLEQQKAAAVLRDIFSKNGVYKVPIDQIVLLANRSKKTNLYITNGGEILLPGKLGGYLAKSKFERDNGVDVARIVGLLQSAVSGQK